VRVKRDTLSPEDRRKLIEAPVTFNIIIPRRSWGGTCVTDEDATIRLHTPNTMIWRSIFQTFTLD